MAQTEEQQVEKLLHATIGTFLAEGKTSSEILNHLQAEMQLTVEEANRVLKAVYDSWSTVNRTLDLQPEDNRNWHQYLRMHLLQKTLQLGTTSSQALALRILDSLAAIQGIATIPEQAVPLSIILVEKETAAETEGEET